MDELQRFQHPRFARSYERLGPISDARGAAEHRRRLLAGLSGRVIEIGAGSGLNFRHYPRTVAQVVAVEPDHLLREAATRAAERAPVPVVVVPGHADDLPGDDASYEAAVASLVLCSVPDPARSLAEIRRVLRPGGQLRIYEHVLSDSPVRAAVEHLVSPLWQRFGAGCHPDRETAEDVVAAGFEMLELERFRFRSLRYEPSATHILGVARKPL